MLELLDHDEQKMVPGQRRYTSEELEGIYLYWRTAGGRSIRKTALRFGCAYESVKSWVNKHEWNARADQEDHDDFSSSRLGVAAIVVNELVPSIEEAVRIRDHGTDDKVRLAAAQWLAGLAGVSPVSKIETAVTDRRETVIEAAPDFANMSLEQLRQYEHSLRKIR